MNSPILKPEELIALLKERLGVSFTIQTLANWRVAKRGPAYLKIGRAVRYNISDVEAWIEAQKKKGDAF